MDYFTLLATIAGMLAGVGADTVGQDMGNTSSIVGDMTLHVIPQSHIDLAWWWRYDPETLDVVIKHTLETAFGNMEKFPDYTFTYLQVPAIAPLESAAPDLFYKLRYYAHNTDAMGERIPNPHARGADGRLAIGSGLWCEVDGCVPCGESLVRQCLYGKRYFWKVFGIDVRTAWFQDAWTHPWTFPQILKKSGMDSYMFTRPRGEGEPMFWWEGPDGSRVFAYKPFEEGGETLASREEIEARLLDVHNRYGVKDDITLVGVGNHGGGAIRADVERMRKAMAQRKNGAAGSETPPVMKFSTPERFVEAVLDSAPSLPVINTELPATIRGAYTTQAEIKKGNRLCENLLLTVEKFASIADRLGIRTYPQDAFYEAWKLVMLNQFHDTISGTDIIPSIEDALKRYLDIEDWGRKELSAILAALSARINTQGPGTPLVVFNPLAWERTDIVEAALPDVPAGSTVRLVDAGGNAVATQKVQQQHPVGTEPVRFVFLAEAVPSLGYKVYWATPASTREDPVPPAQEEACRLENERFLVEIDPGTGCLARVYDKKYKQEVLDESGRGNIIQVLEDFGDSEGFLKSGDGKTEHNIWDGNCRDVVQNPRITRLEQGPVRTVVEIKKEFELSRFSQKITLCTGSDRIDFDLAIDYEGKNQMVKVAFPLSVSSPDAACEIPYGAISRPCNGEEYAMQNWLDVSANGFGVSLLNDGRYGYDVSGNVMRMSVLRSPTGPVAATEEQGVHTLRYALYPHAGSWQEANTVRRGHEFNTPLIAVVETLHQGNLPSKQAFLTVAPENIIGAALKKAEDSGDLILRCYESAGRRAQAQVSISGSLAPDAVHTTDLLERSQSTVPVADNGFQTGITAYSIETFKLIRD